MGHDGFYITLNVMRWSFWVSVFAIAVLMVTS